MSVRSLNKVMLIGNLTRDPELRYTPSGAAVCTLGLATNRSWTTQTGETREETEFHRIVAWNKLAELCSQLLSKGRKIFVEGRLTSRTWTTQDGQPRTTVEIVIDDMIILDPKKLSTAESSATLPGDQQLEPQESAKEAAPADSGGKTLPKSKKAQTKNQEDGKRTNDSTGEEISPDDIPF